MDCSTPGFTVRQQLLELVKIHVHWVSDAIQPSLWSHSPPAFNRSQHQGLFKGVSSSHQGPKYWSFSLSISPHSGLISFRTNWLDLLAVQGTLKSLLQHHSSKHQFFSAQLSLWSNCHIHTFSFFFPKGTLYPIASTPGVGWIVATKICPFRFSKSDFIWNEGLCGCH